MGKIIFLFCAAAFAKETPRVFSNGVGQYLSVTGKNFQVRYIDGEKSCLQKTTFEKKPEGAVQVHFEDRLFPEPYQFFNREPASFAAQSGLLITTRDALVRCAEKTMTYLPVVGEKLAQFMSVTRSVAIGAKNTPCDAFKTGPARHDVGGAVAPEHFRSETP